MDYQQARLYLSKMSKKGIVLGLNNVDEMLKRIGNPHKKLKIIHIAGTNGKGSTLAFISNVLQKAGLKVGAYISPTVFDYRERFQINGVYISEEKFAFYIDKIKYILSDYLNPTAFEIETVIAFMYFLDENVDVVLLETGLGGRLDATNIIKTPLCSVLTSISYDHKNILGDTLTKIATEKAGIIKKNSNVFSYPMYDEVRKVVKKTCIENNSKLVEINESDIIILKSDLIEQEFKYKNKKYSISMLGEFQIYNAALAIEVLNFLKSKFQISDDNIKNGLKCTNWQCRFEIINKNPLIIRDGAHNEKASIVLRNAIKNNLKDKKLIFIIGVLADKEYEKILNNTADLAEKIITITPDNERALNGNELKKIADKYCKDVVVIEDINEAISSVKNISDKNIAIIIFGSLSFIGKIGV